MKKTYYVVAQIQKTVTFMGHVCTIDDNMAYLPVFDSKIKAKEVAKKRGSAIFPIEIDEN